ncbi:MAG: PAS domain S-box protein [Gemmatimonadota bacterium]
MLADDLTEGLVVIDRDSRVRYANPAMTRIFGYGREELEGEPLTTLMPDRLTDAHEAGIAQYLRTGERSL